MLFIEDTGLVVLPITEIVPSHVRVSLPHVDVIEPHVSEMLTLVVLFNVGVGRGVLSILSKTYTSHR